MPDADTIACEFSEQCLASLACQLAVNEQYLASAAHTTAALVFDNVDRASMLMRTLIHAPPVDAHLHRRH